MNLFRILIICVFAVGLGACRKKSETVEKEVREAGYAMTAEGWFEVIRGNDVPVMKKMVKGGFDPKTKDPEGLSGLHVAAEAGSVEAAGYLLDRGLSVDLKSDKGRTPMMLAVLAEQDGMVKWLLSQGADPKAKDEDGFMALMLAVNGGHVGAVEELATYHREDLDSALLLASLVGRAAVIDSLTNYGASVYARMEDGRTPLMLAAENGHHEAVVMLMDIGASRFATTESGDTARSFAVAAGHDEIAAMIEEGFGGQALALESEEEVAEAMEEYLAEFQPEPGEVADDGSLAVNDTGEDFSGTDELPSLPEAGSRGESETNGNGSALPGGTGFQSGEVRTGSDGALIGAAAGGILGHESGSALEGAAIGAASGGITGHVEPRRETGASGVATLAGARVSNPVSRPAAEPASDSTAPAASTEEELPLVMRHYRQRELPVEVKQVSGDVASLRLAGAEPKQVDVRAGESILGSRLQVVRVFSRTEAGKLNEGRPVEVGVVEVEDIESGQRREWVAGRSASSHDPVALVEDAATGRRYLARPGQKFFSEDGREFVVSDVRPSQLVIEETATGEVRTLRLRGPKG